jgi:enamine deaminase RidA (YjgF/YER057c/UK114 family)
MVDPHTSSKILARIRERGIPLPPSIKAQGLYDLVVVEGNMAFVSGQLPRLDDEGALISGRLRAEDGIALARAAAELCFARSLDQVIGDLSRMKRVISIRGFVNADPDFTRHGSVIDAASALAIDLFGDAGRHVRTSLAAGGLPANALVEIELTVALV